MSARARVGPQKLRILYFSVKEIGRHSEVFRKRNNMVEIWHGMEARI